MTLTQSTDYMILDQLLFKLVRDRITKKYRPLLCIPASKINLLLHYFHSSLLGGHMGMTKTYLTISQRFFCPNLAYHIRAYIIAVTFAKWLNGQRRLNAPFRNGLTSVYLPCAKSVWILNTCLLTAALKNIASF